MAPSYKTGRPPSGTVTSSFLLSNLHCPTCVSTIRQVLHEACPDDIRWVSPNIVTSVVTVEHSPTANVDAMAKALGEAGFEVCGATPPIQEQAMAPPGEQASSSRQDIARPTSALSRWVSAPKLPRRTIAEQRSQAQTHLHNCEQCRAKTKGQGPAADPSRTATSTDEPSSSQVSSSTAVDKITAVGSIPAIMSAKSFITVETEEFVPSTWRANLAVGGMTCAVCVNAITDELNKTPWISKVAVNLVSNSATVEFNDKSKVNKVVEMIEDLGYEAAIDSVTSAEPVRPRGQERTVEIFVEGLYCEHCPSRVTNSVVGFRRSIQVVTEPTRERPVIKLTYVPEAPRFTIRHILAAIEAGDPAFTATIYHPPTLEERSKQIQAKHQRQILLRVIFTGIVCIPTFVIGIVYMSLLSSEDEARMFLMEPWTSGISRAQMALFIMATPVYFFAADVFHVRAVKEIRALWRRGSRTPILQRFYRFGSMNTLMSLGTTIAYISSVSQMIAAAAYQAESVSNSNFYFDSVVFLTFFLLLGRLIESYSKSKTGDAVEMLGRLRPTTAILVERDSDEKNAAGTVVQADQLDFGDVVRVTHGASPPADGVVVQGETSFDESSLTGEARPIRKRIGDSVYAGTVNRDGPILARVTGVSGTSMLDQIVAVVREGQTRRAPMEQVADLLTMYFVPIVTLVAIITWIVWLSLGFKGRIPGHFLDVTSGGWVAFSLQFAIAVFVVACPCGLGLAAPTAIFVAGGIAARHGILAKGGGEAFENASRVDVVVFDKTGTLTVGGEPTITDAEVFPDRDMVGDEEKGVDDGKKAELLAALKAVEENSSHPIAKAIVTFCSAKQRSPGTGKVENMQEIPGKGMKATYKAANPADSFELIVGNEPLMADFSVSISARVSELLQQWKSEAKSIALAAARPLSSPEAASSPSFTLAAALSISDPIRPESSAVVAALQARGVRVYMLSGDNLQTARAVASRVGIPPDKVIAEVLPTEKAAQIQTLQQSLHAVGSTKRRATVAMVGDGVNDAPALTQADVGIAVGSGSDVAISSAEFVLVASSSSSKSASPASTSSEAAAEEEAAPVIRSIPTLLDLSRVVFRRITFNFGWALVYNVVAVPVAAGALYPVHAPKGGHVRLDPVWASLAMALSSISVVLSSLALRGGIPFLSFKERELVVKKTP